MRPQRRHFVVEVKRGTNRAAFISTDAAADKFSSAEDALFGPRTAPAPEQPWPVEAAADTAPSSKGRILRDLHEPPPPPPPEPPAPARRGRKPGSKNKPKPVVASAPAATTVPDRPTTRLPVWADLLADEAPETVPVTDPAPAPAPAVESAEDAALPTRRGRLRERSMILKRYVLGTAPAPGQPGWSRMRTRRKP